MFGSKKRSQELAKRRESMLNKALPNPAYQSNYNSVPGMQPEKQGRNWKLIRMKVAIEIYAVKKPNKSEVPKVNKSWRRGILLLKQT